MPGQHADFVSAPLPPPWTWSARRRSGSGRRRRPARRCCSSSSTTWTRNGGISLPFGLVAPVRLTGLPADHRRRPRRSTVTLPAIVHRFEAGHRLRITVATSDQAYATPIEPAVYTVGLADGRPR